MSDECFDYDEFEETLADLRDHLLASDIVSLVEYDQAAALEAVASLFSVVRHASEAMGRLSLVLRRQPMALERIADHLEAMARSLSELVLEEADAEAGA